MPPSLATLESAPVAEWHVLDASTLPFPGPSLAADRRALFQGLRKTYSTSSSIPPGSLSSVTPMSLFSELHAILVYLLALGLPLTVFPLGTSIFFFSSTYIPLLVFLFLLAALTLYPLPRDARASWLQSPTLNALYKYSSYKVVWPAKLDPLIERNIVSVGSGGPHGV